MRLVCPAITFDGDIFVYMNRYSTVTDSTTISSRYHGRNRPRRRKHRLPSGLDRVRMIDFSIVSMTSVILR